MDVNYIKTKVLDEIARSRGVLRLAPAWVGRTILLPGKRLKLDKRDLYPFGGHYGAISERWMASTGMVDNGPTTTENEGMSFIAVKNAAGLEKIRLKDAIDLVGDKILGERIMSRYGGLMAFAKFYDFKTPIPHHVHLMDEEARAVGAAPKPESYYFPIELNSFDYDGAYTFFGLEPGTTREDLKKCLENWGMKGDNGILELSRAYKLKLGTGWNVPGGILHAPGSLVTYEPQHVSDTSLFFQTIVQDRYFERDLLVKFVPDDKKYDLDYLVSCLDWEANLDPDFKKNHYHEPIPAEPFEQTREKGYEEEWISYGSQSFSAKRLTVFPESEVVIKDSEAYGFIMMQGYGTIENESIETPSIIRYDQITCDEYFVTRDRAIQGVTIRNLSDNQNIVMLKHFGPDNKDAEKFLNR
jgi:hypothetical protein